MLYWRTGVGAGLVSIRSFWTNKAMEFLGFSTCPRRSRSKRSVAGALSTGGADCGKRRGRRGLTAKGKVPILTGCLEPCGGVRSSG